MGGWVGGWVGGRKTDHFWVGGTPRVWSPSTAIASSQGGRYTQVGGWVGGWVGGRKTDHFWVGGDAKGVESFYCHS